MSAARRHWPSPTEAVTTPAPAEENYPDFQRRVAANNARVAEKCASLDPYVPRCTACGETGDAGAQCRQNGMVLISRWAEELAAEEFYGLGNFALGGWSREARNLAVLLDQVRAGAKDTSR